MHAEGAMKHGRLTGAVLLGCVWAAQAAAQAPGIPGSVFRDCSDCPEMVVIGPGSFTMGGEGHARETPPHTVSIGYSFAAAKYDVTFDEWDACVADGGCGGLRPKDEGWGRGRRPVINVTWDDAQSCVGWLSRRTGKHYRLPKRMGNRRPGAARPARPVLVQRSGTPARRVPQRRQPAHPQRQDRVPHRAHDVGFGRGDPPVPIRRMREQPA